MTWLSEFWWPARYWPGAYPYWPVMQETAPAEEATPELGPQYQVVVRDETGTVQAIITDYLRIGYSKRVNEAGAGVVVVHGDHDVVGIIQDKYLVEVRRAMPQWDIGWYTDFYGVFREPERSNRSGLDYCELRLMEQKGVLGWRHVLFKTGTANRNRFSSQPAETIMKTLVQYNATADATTGNGRIRNGAITDFAITVEADAGGGNTISSFSCAYDNLLETLAALAQVAGGDWDLIYTGTPGTPGWEFRFYAGQRGSDLTAQVIFALNFDNMRDPIYRIHRLQEKTVAVVAGQGQESDRDVVIRTGTNYAADNDIETVVNATHIEKGDMSGLNVEGDQAMEELKAMGTFQFAPAQTPGTAYGLHYCVDGALGDLVTARYLDISGTFKVTGVDVVVERGTKNPEQIGIEVEAQ